jgi:hypothetical protein
MEPTFSRSTNRVAGFYATRERLLGVVIGVDGGQVIVHPHSLRGWTLPEPATGPVYDATVEDIRVFLRGYRVDLAAIHALPQRPPPHVSPLTARTRELARCAAAQVCRVIFVRKEECDQVLGSPYLHGHWYLAAMVALHAIRLAHPQLSGYERPRQRGIRVAPMAVGDLIKVA